MRKRLTLLTAVVVASLIAAVAAWAGNPHFLRFDDPALVYVGASAATADATIKATATAADSTATGDPRVLIDNIVVSGVKEGVTVSLTAPFEAIYVCVNGGDNVPSAANKTTFVGELSATADFPAARNGRATGSLLTGPLPSSTDAAAATGFSCPSGQRLEFDQVIFSGLVLTVQGGESVTLDDTLVSTSVHGL
jgi:hypothetical protein